MVQQWSLSTPGESTKSTVFCRGLFFSFGIGSLQSLDCLGTYCIDRAGLKVTEICLP